MERRTFLRRTLIGGAALTAAGAVPLWLRSEAPSAARAWLSPALRVLSAAEAVTLGAVATHLVAPLDAGHERVVERVDALLAGADDITQHDIKQLLGLFESAIARLLFDGHPAAFTALSTDAQARALTAWRDSRLSLRRTGFQALQRLCLAVTYSDPQLYAGIGYPGPPLLLRGDGSLVGGGGELRGTP